MFVKGAVIASLMVARTLIVARSFVLWQNNYCTIDINITTYYKANMKHTA